MNKDKGCGERIYKTADKDKGNEERIYKTANEDRILESKKGRKNPRKRKSRKDL